MKPIPSLRSKLLALLARREHSQLELRRKLGDDPQLPELLSEFAERGWQSDQRFAEQYAHQYASRYGRQRLAAELRRRGIADTLIDMVLGSEAPADTQLQCARQLWQKKFGQAALDPRERARQARFLQSRGFSFELIRKVIDGLDDF